MDLREKIIKIIDSGIDRGYYSEFNDVKEVADAILALLPTLQVEEAATTDAVKILHKRYIKDDPQRLQSLEEERKLLTEEWTEYDRLKVQKDTIVEREKREACQLEVEEECQECRGRGEVDRYYTEIDEEWTEKCSTCNGTGKIYRLLTEEEHGRVYLSDGKGNTPTWTEWKKVRRKG